MRRRPTTAREVGIAVLVYGAYLLVGRLALGRDGRDRARRNAERIAALEQRARLAIEPACQRAAIRRPGVVRTLNAAYPVLNVGLTVAWLVALHRRHDPGYLRLRRACVAVQACAQPIFLFAPVAPPRTLPSFVDTLAELSGLDLEHPVLVRFYNPIAALPSLHVAFAVVTALAYAERRRSRRAASCVVVYPVAVGAVVVATGNHFLLDTVTGALLGAAAWRVA